MPTVIDALTITLGLDSTGFKKGAKESTDELNKVGTAVNSVTKDTEDGAKKMALGITKLRNEFLTLTAVIAGAVGIEKFIQNTITGAAASGVMAGKLGLATNEMQAWGKAARDAGSSVEAMNAQLAESTQASTNRRLFGQMPNNIGEIARVGSMYGGGLRLGALGAGGVDWLLERARILQGVPAADRASVAQTLGISSDVQAFAAQGPAAMMASYRSRLQSASVTEDEAKKSLAVTKGFNDFGDALSKVTRELAFKLLPALENFSNGLLRYFGNSSDDVPGKAIDSIPGQLAAGLGAAFGNPQALADIAATKAKQSYQPYNSADLDELASQVDKKYGFVPGTMKRLKDSEKTPRDPKTGTYAVSPVGAAGLMQVMPANWTAMGQGRDINDPIANMDVAAQIFRHGLRKYHNYEMAAAHYNGGAAEVAALQSGNIGKFRGAYPWLKGFGGSNSTSNAETHIGVVNVNAPNATNAAGIGAAVRQTPEMWNFAYQGNTGQQ